MMTRFHLALKSMGLMLLIGVSVCAHSASRSTSMDKTGWTTHCFGRFLVDLPPQAKVATTYKIWGEEITRLYETPDSLAAKISKREQELKAQKHETEGSMFVRREPLNNSSMIMLSWDMPYSKVMLRQDTHAIAQGPWRAFRHGGDVSPGRESIAVRHASILATNLRSRGPNEIPTGPGYCIDGGFIAGSDYRAESFRVGVTLRDHPGMHLAIGASTGAAEDGLLDRVGGFFQTEVMGVAAGIETLRKRKRDIGPIRGEEYLIAASDKGQRVYGFTWESKGKDGSLAEPNIDVALSVLERDPDDGKPPPPAFESDEEALELWDAIIESIRLRPGAA